MSGALPGRAARAPLRVCMLIGLYPPDFAGHGIQTRQLLPHLRAAGVEPTVLAYAPTLRDMPLGEDAAPVLRTLAADGTPLAGLRRTLQVRSHVRRNREHIDVVHSTLVGWPLLANLGFFHGLGLPVLYEMILLGSDDPLAVRGYTLGALKQRLLLRADRFVGISSRFAPRVEAAGIPPSRFQCVYTGVDVDRYRPRDPAERARLRAELDLPPDGRVLVSVGTVIQRKGFDRVVRAFARMAPDPARDRLLVVGPRTVTEGVRAHHAGHAEALDALVAEAGLGRSVRFVGRADDVERYMGAADAFVFLSRREGLGNVILEALASGLPCVVSPLDGIGEELVDEGVCGHVAGDPDDADAVAGLLRDVLEEPTRRRMGDAARERACARYSMRARAEALAGIYRELRAERRAAEAPVMERREPAADRGGH